MAGRVFEQQGRAACAQGAIADLGHLQARVDFTSDALEFAALLELLDKVTQVFIGHAGPPVEKLWLTYKTVGYNHLFINI
jgi:hypothetical protein